MKPFTAVTATAFSLLFCTSLVAAGFALAQVPGRCEVLASERKSEIGCHVSARVEFGELRAGPLFWHLYTYPNRTEAEANVGSQLTVVEALGKVWLYAIAPRDWHPLGGEHAATLGPLDVREGTSYAALYVEAVFPPGMKTTVHRHPGPEASFVISGSECVETPLGTIVSRAGEGSVVPEGVPMQLHSPGPETRRAVALILHASSHHWSVPAPDWTPQGLCAR